MKKERSNFQPDDDGELFPNAMADLEAMLARFEADQALDSPLDEFEAIDVDALSPEQLLETMQVGLAVQEQILDAWGRDLATQAVALGLDPKVFRLPC